MIKKVLISGITGQDGSYLAEFLLKKGYKVYGLTRRTSTPNYERIKHIVSEIELIPADLLDQHSLTSAVQSAKPDEVYNLAAQSFVTVSWHQPVLTGEFTALGVTRMLEAVKLAKPDTKFYQASSSECFGRAEEVPQTEKTPFHPRSPYAVAKVYGHWITVNYRESFDMFCVSGILFNHESERRGLEFVTRKVTNSVAKIKLGLQDKLHLGNLDAKRDWGYAPDYCIDLDTSILTNKGFKYYDEIHEGDVVLNYNSKKDRLEEDEVLRKILLNHDGDMCVFEGRGIKLKCSPNHRIYYQRKSKNSKGGWSDWKVTEAEDFYKMIKDLNVRTKYDFRLPHTQNYYKKDLPNKDEWFKLIGYLVAEGSRKDNNGSLTISLSQSKKVNRKVYNEIKDCLGQLRLKFRERERTDGVSEFIFDAKSSNETVEYFDGFDIHSLPVWIFKAGSRQMELVLKAMMDGDGSWGAMTYISKRKDLVHSFQTLATILGYRTIVHNRKSGTFETVLISKRKKYAYITKCSKEQSKGKIWCITTKNGTIVTNKDSCIAVSGNCEAMWLMLQQKKPQDFVIGTGESHSVKELVKEAFLAIGIKNWEKYVVVDKTLLRPADVENLVADYSKAKKLLGWEPMTKFAKLVKIMVESDLELESKNTTHQKR